MTGLRRSSLKTVDLQTRRRRSLLLGWLCSKNFQYLMLSPLKPLSMGRNLLKRMSSSMKKNLIPKRLPPPPSYRTPRLSSLKTTMKTLSQWRKSPSLNQLKTHLLRITKRKGLSQLSKRNTRRSKKANPSRTLLPKNRGRPRYFSRPRS